MIDIWSAVCGAIAMVIFQVILAIVILKWINRKKKDPDEEKNIVDKVVEEYKCQEE